MAWARHWCVAPVLLAAAVVGWGAEAALLQPHRAIYRLSLSSRHHSSSLLEVRGGLVIEWELACDGWLSRQRLGFVGATTSGESFNHDVRFSSWEAIDGSRLRYTVRSFDGEEIEEEYRGEAAVEGTLGGIATFVAPEEQDVRLPPGTIFPTDHMRQVLAGALAGEHFVRHEVFDGWGYDALTQITTIIGKLRPFTSVTGEGGEVWPVAMAYHDLQTHDMPPTFEALFLLDQQGVLHELMLDYGDFQLDASLERLERLERPDC